MPVSKTRPGKGRRPRPTLLPGMTKHAHKTETPVLMAIEALGKPWFSIHQLDEIFLHGEIVRRIGDPEMSARGYALVKAALAIKDRYDRTDKMGCNGDEIKAIKEAARVTIPWFQMQPNTVINKALEEFENATRRVYRRLDA